MAPSLQWKTGMSRVYFLIPILGILFCTSCFLKKDEDSFSGPRVAIGFSEFDSTLDWHKPLNVPGTIAVSNIMTGLVEYDYDGSQAFITPSLAEKWESHQGGAEWVFKLKRDRKWSDGKPLIADHFMYSFKRLIQPDTSSPFASVLFAIKNAKEFNSGKIKNFEEVGIQRVDEYTLRFVLNKASERFPHTFTHVSTYPMREEHIKMFSAIKKQYDQTPWLGPYKLLHHTKKRISLFSLSESGQQIRRFDLMTDVKKEKLTKMLKDKKVNLIFNADDIKMRNLRRFRLPTFEIMYISFLTKNKPLNNPIIRRIFSHCINKDEVAQLEPQSFSLGGVIPPGVEGYESNRGARFDPDMAKLVLRNAKYDAEIKKYEYPLYVQSPSLLPIAKNLKDQWKKCLNLDIKIMPDPYDNNPKTMGMVLQKLTGYSLDPTYYLSLFDKNSDSNITGWKNFEYEQYLRKPALAKAQHLLVEEEIPVLPLLSYFHSVATRTEVRGLKQNFVRYIDFKSITLERVK